MLDPFPFAPPAFLTALTIRLADYLNLDTIPYHIHEFLFAVILYHTICTYISPLISNYFFPRIYSQLPYKTKLNWDVHIVSLTQSTIINVLALYVMWNDEERAQMDFRERVWGYTGGGGLVQAMAGGYFAWDLWMTAMHVDVFGQGMLAHATSAAFVYSLGYRPFVNYYGPVFILYELSSPFLNFHWFFDKLGMTGSDAQLYNGIVLIFTFFGARLVWGPYNTYRVFSDIWRAIQYQKTVEGKVWLNASVAASSAIGGKDTSEILKFARGKEVPIWLAVTYLTSNIVLTSLNIYWFGKMIETIRKRFEPPFGTKKVEEKEIVMGRGLDDHGTKSVEIDSTEIKHRLKRAANSFDTPPPT